MNTEKQIPWLTDKMTKGGLTAHVINYLTGAEISTNFSWTEFFTIWMVCGDTFPLTSLFKVKMEIFLQKRKDRHFSKKIDELKAVIPNKDVKELLIRSLPFHAAVELCTEFWDYWRLFNRIKNRRQKEKILQLIRELIVSQEFTSEGFQGMLFGYYRISQDFPVYREAALLLIESKVPTGDETLWNLKEVITYSHYQIKGLLSAWEKGSRTFMLSDLFKLLLMTSNPLVRTALIKYIKNSAKEHELDRVFEYIAKNLHKKSVNAVKMDIYGYLPILAAAVEKLPNLQSEEKFTALLPPFDEKNEYLVTIVNKVTDIMKMYQKSITQGQFYFWYSYCKSTTLIELCITTIAQNKAYWGLENAVQAYTLCQNPSIIYTAIDIVLPSIDHASSDDLTFFFAWVKDYPNWWSKTKEVIFSYNKMEQWWSNLYSNTYEHYLNVVKALQ